MNNVAIFLTGIGLTLAGALLVILFIRHQLRLILVDLCGTEMRATFWTTFSNALILLIPLIFALNIRPADDAEVPILFQVCNQVKWGLIGLASTLMALGIMISRFIPDAASPQPKKG